MSLLSDLSKSFHSQNLSLTASFAGKSYDYVALSQYLDRMHLYLPQVSIEKVKNSDVPSSKLVLAIYFMGFEGVYDINGDFRREKLLRYDEVCNIESSNGNVILDKAYDEHINRIRIQYGNQKGEIRYIQFDNTRTVAHKTRYAMRNNFGGVLAYAIDYDSLGKCGIEADTFNDFKPVNGVILSIPTRHNRTAPLLRTINDAIVVSIDEIEQERQLIKSNQRGWLYNTLMNNFLTRRIFWFMYNSMLSLAFLIG